MYELRAISRYAQASRILLELFSCFQLFYLIKLRNKNCQFIWMKPHLLQSLFMDAQLFTIIAFFWTFDYNIIKFYIDIEAKFFNDNFSITKKWPLSICVVIFKQYILLLSIWLKSKSSNKKRKIWILWVKYIEIKWDFLNLNHESMPFVGISSNELTLKCKSNQNAFTLSSIHGIWKFAAE